MTHARRRIAVGLLVGSCLLAGSAGPALAGGRKAPKLTFNKAVALTSFSPLRTAVGTVYSLQREQRLSEHEWSGEPSLQINDDGTIFIAGTCCVVASSPLWHSVDGGKTFKELESPGHAREFGVGAEGDLAVDHDGGVYFIDTSIAGLIMSKWTDQGRHWEYSVQPAGPIPGFDDRPWLAISDKALYLYINHVTHTAVYRSTDGGLTWTNQMPLAWRGNALGQPFFPAHIAAHEKKDTLWVSGVVSEGGQDTLGSAVSTDGGTTYTQSVVSKPQRGAFSPIFTGATAVDDAGNGYVTWSTTDPKGCDVYYASSSNNGKSWSKPVKLNKGKGCATFPWITAKGNGKVGVVWYETPATGPAGAAERARRTVMGKTIYNGLEIPLTFQDEVSENAKWYLHAAAVTAATKKKPQITSARVPTRTPVMQGPLLRELWDFLQVDIGSDGRLHIAFVEKFNDPAPQTYYVSSKTGPRLK